MSFAKFVEKDRRLTVLLALESAAEYSANHFLLNRFCGSMGHSVSMAQTLQDLAWLDTADLLTLAQSNEVIVATLTQNGVDVANGRTTVQGVARPAPGQD
jgi:hypothetical protein